MKKKILFTITFLFLAFSFSVKADTLGQERKFFIEPTYDSKARSELTAVLVDASSQLYVYADKDWWNSAPQEEIYKKIRELSSEFSSKIYPVIVSNYGSEWTPGIDNDSRITVLIHPMNGEAGGYFRSNDEYSKLQTSVSNEREMVYINSTFILDKSAKSFLAHEFMHLVTFNQKDIKQGESDDTWLDEARSEYVPTLLGYDDEYVGSYLEKRVQTFSEKPTGSLVDWQNTKYDYARINLFIHYMVDHYGQNILSDSLKSSYVGIDSINYALRKNNFKETFSQIFSDWTIAVLVNDCDYGSKYCYLNKNLNTFNILTQVNYLPVSGESTLTFAERTKSWSGSWFKIIGGGGGLLKFNFVGDATAFFKVYYITKNRVGAYKINTVLLNSAQKGGVQIVNFGNDVTSLYIVSHLISVPGTNDSLLHDFSWSTSVSRTITDTPTNNTEEIKRLLAIIEDLKQKIAVLLAQQTGASCTITVNLSFGMQNSDQVKCLQNFLRLQGQDIYPEGLVTGNFGSLTKSAVIRFQEKYRSEILTPVGLSSGTGYVGEKTRYKINQILSTK